MSGELWAPGKPSFTKPYCGKRGSAAADPIFPSYSWDSDEETEQSPEPKSTNEKQLFLKTRNGNIRSTGQQCTPKAEEGYCKHINQIASKLSTASYAVRTLTPLLSLNALKMLYFSYAHSIISYDIIFWGASTNSIKIFRLQK